MKGLMINMMYFIKQYWRYFAMALAFASASYLINYIQVNADTYYTNSNLFENTYTNNLIDMANSQIDNLDSKKYIIIQVDYNYYMFISDNYEISNNQVTMNDTTIIQAIRAQNGYNYYYDYSKVTQNQSIININNVVVSNLSTSYSITGKRFEDYKYSNYVKRIGVFILGIVFAIFLTKERNY